MGEREKRTIEGATYLELEMRQDAGRFSPSTLFLLGGLTRPRGSVVFRYEGYANFTGNEPLWTLALELNGDSLKASGFFQSEEILGLDDDAILNSILDDASSSLLGGFLIDFESLFDTDLTVTTPYLYRERYWSYVKFDVPAPYTTHLIFLGIVILGWMQSGPRRYASWILRSCTSAKDMASIGPLSKRDFSAGCFSSLAC
jgi:hypothetical protein